MAAGAHRVLTIEVWHQTSGRKGTNNLRDDQLVPAGIDMEACHRKCVTLLREIGICQNHGIHQGNERESGKGAYLLRYLQ